jgi:hypothetical protein
VFCEVEDRSRCAFSTIIVASGSHAVLTPRFFLMIDRYPNHEASKRIENSDEHKEELSKLRSPDGDYHHGFHSGVLAAARMFREQSKIVHINEHDELDEEFWNEVEEHSKKMEESKEKFPHLDVNQFPAPELVESKDE